MAHENELVNVLGLKSSLLEFKDLYINSSVLADWNQTDSTAADYIKNKPVIIAAEHVTVTVTAPNGASVVGRTLTLNGTDYVLDSSPATVEIDIASGTQYTVSIDDIAGYLTPTALSYTASQISRNISMQYTNIPNGVYAYYSNGVVKTTGTSDAIGVAVVTSNCRFVIDKVLGNNQAWSSNSDSLENSGVLITTNRATALSDYNGYSNTTKIINALGSDANFANYCRGRFGGKGYLGALGEWNIVYQNKSAIDSMMSVIGGTSLYSQPWTSTLYNSTAYVWMLNLNNGSTSGTNSWGRVSSGVSYPRAFMLL